MKTTVIGAIALLLAVPAAAQTAPAADPHAGHKMDHSQHQGMDHSKHGDQAKHDCKACCDKAKQQGGKMECMDQKDGAKAAAPASAHDGHEGHAH